MLLNENIVATKIIAYGRQERMERHSTKTIECVI